MIAVFKGLRLRLRKAVFKNNLIMAVFDGYVIVFGVLINCPVYKELIFMSTSYSSFKLLMGLAIAALIDWKLTVSRAIIIVRKPAPKNMVMGTVVLKANPSSQFEVKYNATGSAIILAIMIKSKNSLFSICIILKTVAPRTFLMPISLVFSCAV
ncbi:hypothetical protein D3C80_1162880 [compost metagenome]